MKIEQIEQKAKAYDKALEMAKNILETDLHESGVWAIKKIFPELKESEDERIRKALISIVNWLGFDSSFFIDNSVTKSKVLAHLEKQKEQKSISAEEVLVKAGLKLYKDGNQWCVLTGDNIQEGICGFGDTIEDALYEFLKEILDLQKEQKPAKWSKKDREMLYAMIDIVSNSLYEPIYPRDEMLSWLKSLRPQPKVEWSEEDLQHKSWILECLADGERKMPEYAEDFRAAYKWLKSLQPQAKQEQKLIEWSEEDEKIHKAVVEFFESEPDNNTYSFIPKRDILVYLKKRGEQKPEAKLTGWVVRDRSGEIWVHDAYPKKEYEIWVEGRYLPLNQNSFPDLKWGDEPVEVEITIRKK